LKSPFHSGFLSVPRYQQVIGRTAADRCTGSLTATKRGAPAGAPPVSVSHGITVLVPGRDQSSAPSSSSRFLRRMMNVTPAAEAARYRRAADHHRGCGGFARERDRLSTRVTSRCPCCSQPASVPPAGASG
jgi:hypothetical protein